MYIVASITSTFHSGLKERWKREGAPPILPRQKVALESPKEVRNDEPLFWTRTDYSLPARSSLGPSVSSIPPDHGMVLIYDWESGQIVWQSRWTPEVLRPFGLCFSHQTFYVADVETAHVFAIDFARAGRIERRLSHPAFNDLHTINPTARGLLVASSGADAIVEIDSSGELLWEWWAGEHGYEKTPSGRVRKSGRGVDHRNKYYRTVYHSTHVNSAVAYGDRDRYVAALLFHQGQLIRIDRDRPIAEQRSEVMLDQLMRPHSLQPTPSGWLLANSVGGELLLLDRAFVIVDRIPYDGGWIQSCTRLSDGRILLNDIDNHILAEFAPTRPWKITRTVRYDSEWRMAELAEVPAGDPALQLF